MKWLRRKWRKIIIWWKLRELKKQDPFVYEEDD